MNAGDALLADILAEPNAEDLRLIYADWLEEHGNKGQREHATLIRWQVETGVVLRQERGSKRWQRLGGKKFGKAPSEFWRAAGSLVPWWVPGPVVIERGFLAEVGCECNDWMHYGPRLVRRHPIRSVRLVDVVAVAPSTSTQAWTTRHPPGPELARSPRWGWMESGKAWLSNHDSQEALWAALSDDALAWACATPAHPGNYVVAVETAPIPASGP
jgi:uncharacterized protein (TIGR02996 family)